MNYWHIMMHPGNRVEFNRARVTRILEETGYVGVGDWDEGAGKIKQFEEDVKIGDIVLVRSEGPLALVEIVGELEYEAEPNEELDWFQHRRKVKILGWDSPEIRKLLPRKLLGVYPSTSFSIVYQS